MDPLTQGVLGAVASQNVSKKKEMGVAIVIGALAGMAADLDIFIQSATDPMMYFKYHRHFTHSLFFIPFGALIVSCLLHFFLKKKLSFKQNYLYSFLGYFTHGLLDSCTSYGTLLLWPFSERRIAWNNISIIDPLFTIPLIILLILSYKKKERRYARGSLLFIFCYFSLGFFQNYRAESVALTMAKERGHSPVRIEARPSFANLLVWRVLYEYEGYFYSDAVRVGLKHKFFAGDKIKKLNLAIDFPWVKKDSQHFVDIEKFRWFSKDYLAIHPDDPLAIGDIRYSLSPDSIYPLWGIKLKMSQDDQHVTRITFHRGSLALRKRWSKFFSDF